MDPRQRLGDMSATLDMHAIGNQSQIWTALPGIVQSFDPAKMTCEVQPSIQGVLSDPKTGAASNTNLPLLVDCPVCFPGFGDAIMTFPISAGDECLVIFASRCIDGWWQSGGVQAPLVYRMHDLSDGFVLPGGRSQVNLVGGISTSTTQLRSIDGATCVELDAAAQAITLTAPGGINLNGPVNLGGEGGAKVARVGDSVSGGVITTGSETVKAA
jgi:hypothetical protein